MRTIIIDIINDKAERALEELEQRHLIKMRNKIEIPVQKIDWSRKYKGVMTKDSPEAIENQLNELRKEWE